MGLDLRIHAWRLCGKSCVPAFQSLETACRSVKWQAMTIDAEPKAMTEARYRGARSSYSGKQAIEIGLSCTSLVDCRYHSGCLDAS